MVQHYGLTRYSRWDGTQQIAAVDADEIMRAISEDLLQNSDLDLALRRLFRWGFERNEGEHVPGLQDLMNRLKERRQEQLNRYDLGSVLDDVKEKLAAIVAQERATIERRLEDVGIGDRGTGNGDKEAAGPKSAAPRDSVAEQGHGQHGGEAAGSGGTAPGESDGGSEVDPRQILAQIARKKLDRLAGLPDDPGGTIRELTQYDFMDPEARQAFQDLLAMLQQQMLQSTFQGMQQALGQMTPDDIAEMRQMMGDLNEMLEARQRGEAIDFDQFMHKWGHFFGPDVKNLDDLMAHMQRQMAAMQGLMESLSPEQRGQLQDMMQAIASDPGLQEQLNRLGENLGQMLPGQGWRQSYRFSGDESLTLAEAVRMMDRLEEYDQLEAQLRDVQDWRDLANINDGKFRDLLGEEEGEQMTQLRELTKLLEDAGYVKKGRRGYELTPQGVRKIGEKALADIFQDLKKDKLGQHDLRHTGGAGERTDTTKEYEFGDPFLLDLPKTVMNAVQRGGAGSPVRLNAHDFEVYRTEYSTRSSTVLMVDMSRSMLYNGCFMAAKKVALALDSLIRGKYPRDHLSIIGFALTAKELQAAELPTLNWDEYNYGTNMQHGFQIARQILGRQKGSNRQIIVITDGEPTAHFEEGHIGPRFTYPTSPRTYQQTLKEVLRCTREGITINTFMLERSPYMIQFVNDMMKVNTGRVFIATPDRLGEYILVDYVANKQKWIG